MLGTALNALGLGRLGELPISKENLKIQTKLIDIATGVTAGTYDYDLEFDTSYHRVIGIALNEITTGDQTYYRVGIDDGTGKSQLELVHKNMIQASAAQGQDQKWQFIKMDIESGAVNKVRVQVPATVATTNLTFELSFLLFRSTNPNR